MLPQEVIRKKRDAGRLTDAEIDFMVEGIVNGNLSKVQVAAFAMTVFFRGLDDHELTRFTSAMARSGRRIDWSDLDLPGPVVDKHSTGGVGDKPSLILAPIVAACGGFVPMISGRGLGHTGGTLDKLRAIPGYRVQPEIAEFRRVVREVGCAIVGQTDDLAPADRRLYAIRDVTGSVESVPLIVSSILAKKLAAGLQGLVMDVKTGSGAFAADPGMAAELATRLVSVANEAGLPTVALITDMDSVLGRTVGNALEIAETIDCLCHPAGGDQRLLEISIELAAEMLLLGRLVGDIERGRARARAALEDGSAAEVFARMVRALGGPSDLLQRRENYLATAPLVRDCGARRSGFVVGMDARRIGIAVVALGGGRAKAADTIDPAVGLSDFVQVGTRVAAGQTLCRIHAADATQADAAEAILQAAIVIGEAPPAARPVIMRRLAP